MESDESTMNSKDSRLIGEVNEVNIMIGGKSAKALLDTGSVVSLVTETFYNNNLSNIEIKPVGEILNIECADGESLPYKGYIEIDIRVESGLPSLKTLPCLFLVTPDTSYSERTPIVLGTNTLHEFMDDCKNQFGDQFLQKAKLHTPWY